MYVNPFWYNQALGSYQRCPVHCRRQGFRPRPSISSSPKTYNGRMRDTSSVMEKMSSTFGWVAFYASPEQKTSLWLEQVLFHIWLLTFDSPVGRPPLRLIAGFVIWLKATSLLTFSSALNCTLGLAVRSLSSWGK